MVNIQVTHSDPQIAAMEMDDKRVSKMILESAQMICTVTQSATYKPVHQNNPTTHWAKLNIDWLITWHHALAAEHYYRHGKIHKSFSDVGQYYRPNKISTRSFRNGARTSRLFPDGTQIDFTHIADPHQAYRYYLRSRMLFDTRQPMWTRRHPPWWLNEVNTTGKPMLHDHDVWPRQTKPMVFKANINQLTIQQYNLKGGPRWWE